MDLKELYQEMILDHNKSPRNFGRLDGADQSAEGYNPLCGDHYWFHVRFDGDKVAEVKFEGSGCAISKSSASVMTSIVKGKHKAEIDEIFQRFRAMITGETKPDESLGKLVAFSGVCEHPSRVKCAILPWHTLHSALQGEMKATTE